jgi:glucose-1-phosphate adenylyltransferase
LVDGKVHGSLIARSVIVEKDAEIEESIIMASCTISEKAYIKHAILDKNVVVEPGIKIIGSAEQPVVIKKNTHVLSDVYGGE